MADERRTDPGAGPVNYDDMVKMAAPLRPSLKRRSLPPLLAEPDAPFPGASSGTYYGGINIPSASAPVTSITASVTVPTLSGQSGSLASAWVGFSSGANILQTGFYFAYDNTKTGNCGFAGLSPWTWWLGGANSNGSEIWDPTAFPLTAGDSLTLSMSYSPTGYWTVTQTNNTKSWTYTEYKSFQSVGTCLTAWPYPLNSAYIIIENELADAGQAGSNLPNYGTMTFSDIAMVPAVNPSTVTYITTVDNTHTTQSPGAYSGGAFTMTWGAYS